MNNIKAFLCLSIGHRWKPWEYNDNFYSGRPDNCYETRSCKLCGLSEERWIEPHEWGLRKFSCSIASEENCQIFSQSCLKCGYTTQEKTQHAWGEPVAISPHQDDIVCSECGRTRSTIHHTFEGCVCKYCGFEDHEVKRCRCTKCGQESHRWIGCTCFDCFQERHQWEGCKCVKCGQEHDFKEVDEDSHRCSICGLTEAHNLNHQTLASRDTHYQCTRCSYSHTSEYNDW